jgi:hypothetical protein
MRDYVVRYVRHPNTNRMIGCVVAVRTLDGIKFGFSQCNPKDQFSKVKGRSIAIQRALIGSQACPSGITVKAWCWEDKLSPYITLTQPRCMTERNVDVFSEVIERVGEIAERVFCTPADVESKP